MSSSASSFISDTESSVSNLTDPTPRRCLYPCRQCGFYITTKYLWYKHIINEHGRAEREENKDTFYTCSQCDKIFQHRRSRDAHKKVHEFMARIGIVPDLKPVNVMTPKKMKTDGDSEFMSDSPSISTGA